MNKHILVVDSSRTIRHLLSTYFKNAGHSVILCPTPRDALQTLATLGDAPPDVIFLAIDQQKEAYRVIYYTRDRTKYKEVRFVIMMEEEEKSTIQHALKDISLVAHYLVKPFHIQDAIALISAPLPETVSEAPFVREVQQ